MKADDLFSLGCEVNRALFPQAGASNRSPRVSDPRGAFRTFCHLRRMHLSGEEARTFVRRCVATPLGQYEPNPLCTETRTYLVARYERGSYTGD